MVSARIPVVRAPPALFPSTLTVGLPLEASVVYDACRDKLLLSVTIYAFTCLVHIYDQIWSILLLLDRSAPLLSEPCFDESCLGRNRLRFSSHTTFVRCSRSYRITIPFFRIHCMAQLRCAPVFPFLKVGSVSSANCTTSAYVSAKMLDQ